MLGTFLTTFHGQKTFSLVIRSLSWSESPYGGDPYELCQCCLRAPKCKKKNFLQTAISREQSDRDTESVLKAPKYTGSKRVDLVIHWGLGLLKSCLDSFQMSPTILHARWLHQGPDHGLVPVKGFRSSYDFCKLATTLWQMWLDLSRKMKPGNQERHSNYLA